MQSDNQLIPDPSNPALTPSYNFQNYNQGVTPTYSNSSNYLPQACGISDIRQTYSQHYSAEHSYLNSPPVSNINYSSPGFHINYSSPSSNQNLRNPNINQSYNPQNYPSNPSPQAPETTSYIQTESALTYQNYNEGPQYNPNNFFINTEDSAHLPSHSTNPENTVDDHTHHSGPYSTLTPEQSEHIKNRLSETTGISSFRYKLQKLSELIKVQAQQKQFRKIIIQKFVVTSDVDTAVETTSNGWIKLEVMKKFGMFNPDFIECIKLLDSKYHISGWKKSRGDGNCYYRAVITRYFDIIFGVYSLSSNIDFFLAILANLKEFSEKRYEFEYDYVNALDHVIFYTNELKRRKESDPYDTYQYLNELFQYSEVDLNLVRVSRMLTYMGLITRASDYAEFGMNITENYSSMILTMGEEAQEFALMLLPLELCIQVVQYNLFNKVHIEKFPDDSEKTIKVHIVRRGGHYDILYTKQECEHDMFNFCSGTYHFLESS